MKKHAILLAAGTLLSLGLYAQDAGSKKAAPAKLQKEASPAKSSSNVSSADSQKNKQAQQPLQRDEKQPAATSDPAVRKQKQ